MSRKVAILAAVAASCALWLGAGTLSRLGLEDQRPRSRKHVAIPAAAHNLEAPGVTPQWLESVGRNLERYERTIRAAKSDPETFVAASKACFATIRPGGMNIVSSWHEDTWSLDWKWCSIQGLSPEPAVLSTPGEFVLHVDRGPIREIFENRKDGLEHVIEVKEKPASAGPLRVDVAVASDLAISSPKPADRLEFTDSSGTKVLRYRGLKVWDAVGKELKAGFEVTPTGFAITVQDSLAKYPVTIDPIFDAQDWELTGPVGGPGGTTGMGFSVAAVGDIDGDGSVDLAVGAPFLGGFAASAGTVWVFLGSDVGTPDDVADFTFFGNDQAGSLFGWSVAGGDVDGDTFSDVIVGNPLFDTVGAADGGAAWVYIYDDPGAFDPGMILPPAGGTYQAGAQRGYCVANAGDVTGGGVIDFVVGEPFFDIVGAADSGQVTLYADPLGAPIDVINGAPLFGAPQAGELFGWSLALAGDPNDDGVFDLLVGAPGFDDLGDAFDDIGGVYFYFADVFAGTYMVAPSAFVTGDEEEGAQFGYSVVGNVDVNLDGTEDALIGAPFFGDTDMGAAYIYYGDDAAGLELTYAWTSSGEEEDGANYGYAVAWGNDGQMLVGAPGYDDERGRAYAYAWSESGGDVVVDEDEPAYESGEEVGHRFGHSMVIFGSFDDDGFLDAFVGAPGYEDDDPDPNQGRVYGFYDN